VHRPPSKDLLSLPFTTLVTYPFSAQLEPLAPNKFTVPSYKNGLTARVRRERDRSDSKMFQKVIIEHVQYEPFHIL
jgi:hypothetical protein